MKSKIQHHRHHHGITFVFGKIHFSTIRTIGETKSIHTIQNGLFFSFAICCEFKLMIEIWTGWAKWIENCRWMFHSICIVRLCPYQLIAGYTEEKRDDEKEKNEMHQHPRKETICKNKRRTRPTWSKPSQKFIGGKTISM